MMDGLRRIAQAQWFAFFTATSLHVNNNVFLGDPLPSPSWVHTHEEGPLCRVSRSGLSLAGSQVSGLSRYCGTSVNKCDKIPTAKGTRDRNGRREGTDQFAGTT